VKTISVTVGEDERTIEDVYEPYLIRRGYLAKTPRGRVLGPRADEVPGIAPDAPPREKTRAAAPRGRARAARSATPGLVEGGEE
jgi:Holliday junction DNA helicase RuvB